MPVVEVVFFAADPHSAPLSGSHGEKPRLMIDEEVREIREKVRLAEHRDRLYLNTHWATRTDDLLQLLNERKPQVVHFSGHGARGGITVVGADPTHQQRVESDALAEFFRVFRGDIRLVVLNACWSVEQARTISQVVGCAIGTPNSISDDAAITFSASFYRAIAFGESVQAAFDQARAALNLDSHDARRHPQLLHRADVDPARLVLIPDGGVPPSRRPRAMALATVLLLAMGIATVKLMGGADEARHNQPGNGGDTMIVSGPSGPTLPGPRAPGTDSVRDSGPGTSVPALAEDAVEGDGARELAAARDLREAGSHDAAFPLFRTAAAAGNAEAMAFLGISYFNGEGTERQPGQGIVWVRRAAEAGNARGMNALGYAYERGWGIDRSNERAKLWYRAAAERGYTPAMMNLGIFYQQYVGPDSGYARAREWYGKAAAAGDLEGMVNLGVMHAEGMGTPPDTAEALRLYLRAAHAGSARGMVRAGKVYEDRGDYATARAWFLKGVDAGDAHAMNNMGVLYYHGRGVRRDRDEAIRWFRQAARAGSVEATGNLSAMGVR